MKRSKIRMISMGLALMLAAGSLQISVSPVQADEGAVTGTYQFTSTKDANRQIEDQFVFQEDWFWQSSFEECSPLAELSIQTALASASWYGPEVDPYERDYSENAHNLIRMLEALGFEDISTNAWYSLEKEENSIGVGIGHKLIVVPQEDGTQESYTLLAIIPRSSGYKREWAGDFTVGDGDIHEGFLAARDEILRFIRSYIEENQIRGKLKVWTAGHSRGSSVAGLTAAFFAGGGIGYFGEDVSITPEDVYCYGFATPGTVKEKCSKDTELHVAAARGGEYMYDTPGDEYETGNGGMLNPHEETYRGIHNYTAAGDMFTFLPPQEWGFTCYGTVSSPDRDGLVTMEDMLEELKTISPSKYEKITTGGDPRNFVWMTYDLSDLMAVPVENAPDDGLEVFLAERAAALTAVMPDTGTLADAGGQGALKSIGGLYGLLANNLKGGLGGANLALIKGGVLGYLDYGAERLMAEGRAENEEEAVVLVIKDMLEFATGSRLEKDDFTADDFIGMLMRYIADHEDSILTEKVVSSATSALFGKATRFMMRMKLQAFCKNTVPGTSPQDEEMIRAYLKACAYGPEEGTMAAGQFQDAAAVRKDLYNVLFLFIKIPALDLKKVLGTDAEGNPDGSASFGNLVTIMSGYFLAERTVNGKVRKKYRSIGEAADANLAGGIDTALSRAIEETEDLYGKAYHDAALSYLEDLKNHITEARRLLFYTLFYTEGDPFSTKVNVMNAITFTQNNGIIAQGHAGEIYLAWARAVNRKS